MTTTAHIADAGRGLVRELAWRGGVVEALRGWPEGRPLACVVAGGTPGRWSRWSILAAPSRSVSLSGDGVVARLGELLNGSRREAPAGLPDGFPFVGGWIGRLSYDLGREIEPAAQNSGARMDREWATAELFRCDGALVHDAVEDRWWAVGDEGAVPAIGAGADTGGPPVPPGVEVGTFVSNTGRAGYVGAVWRALELIAAGDVFQVNLAHRLSATFEGRPRELAARLLESARPWYGGWVESWDEQGLRSAVLSLSPELLVDVDLATRRVVTRPIKGTRPAGVDARELLESEKDQAELTMIVDLMRNDLGRVCEYGSVRVECAREIEAHAGVIHGVATVAGLLREDVGHAELLRAAFPAGSVTGAPKVRAMQIIDELEPSRRGPYCGSVGFVSDHGRACWNVAIRTAALRCEAGSGVRSARGVIDYSVGAGIVADSDAESEWEETLQKSRVLDGLGGVGDR